MVNAREIAIATTFASRRSRRSSPRRAVSAVGRRLDALDWVNFAHRFWNCMCKQYRRMKKVVVECVVALHSSACDGETRASWRRRRRSTTGAWRNQSSRGRYRCRCRRRCRTGGERSCVALPGGEIHLGLTINDALRRERRTRCDAMGATTR